MTKQEKDAFIAQLRSDMKKEHYRTLFALCHMYWNNPTQKNWDKYATFLAGMKERGEIQ